MNTIKTLITKYKELIVYVIFGVCTTFVNLVVFKISNLFLGDEKYLISNVFAWFFSVIFAYTTNKIFVFKSKDWGVKTLVKEVTSFFSSRIFTFLIEEFGLYLLVDVIRFKDIQLNILTITINGEMIAKILVSVVVVILNYVFSKLFIFKSRQNWLISNVPKIFLILRYIFLYFIRLYSFTLLLILILCDKIKTSYIKSL